MRQIVESVAGERRWRGSRATRGASGAPHGRRWTDGEPKVGWAPTLAIILLIAFADWVTKFAVASTIPVGDVVEVWDGRVALWHVQNPEMVLGLWGSFPLATRQAIAATAGVVGLLLLFEIVGRGHRLPHHRRPWVWVFVGTAFGGMLGNLGERAFHWAVTDFLSIGLGNVWLPPGNIADLALLVSIPLAVPVIVFELEARRQRRSESSAHPSPIGPYEGERLC